MTTKIKTGIKLKVNPEQSLYVQNICFANGIYWIDETKDLYFPQYQMYYITIYSKYFNYSILEEEVVGKELEEIDTMLFIRTNGTCVEEEIKTNKEDEESEMVKEEKVYKNDSAYLISCAPNKEDEENIVKEKVYKNAKEYLMAKGIYGKTLNNCIFKAYKLNYLEDSLKFSLLFNWEDTQQGFDFWNKVNTQLCSLGLDNKLDDILEDASFNKNLVKEDYKKKHTQDNSQYLVYVEGKQPPKKVHNSLKSAQKEANRLAKREVGYVTYIVEVVNKYIATVSVEEVK